MQNIASLQLIVSPCHLLRIAAEAISNPRLSHDVAWLGRVVLDLAPQLIHKHPQLGEIVRLAGTPHFCNSIDCWPRYGRRGHPLYLCFVFALGERKKRNTKEDKVTLRNSKLWPPHKSCHQSTPGDSRPALIVR